MAAENEARLETKADVVFLVDVTGSMQDCIDALKQNVGNLASSLEGESNVKVDWRAKVIGYRDLEADPEPDQFVGKDNAFVSTSAELASQIAPLEAKGGGPGQEEIPESALDALKMAIDTGDWIDIGQGHRIVVLLTDAPTKPQTVDGEDAQTIAQKAAEGHFRVLVYGPNAPEYELLGKLPKSGFTDVAGGASPDVYEGLKNLDWKVVYETLSKSVSQPAAPGPAPAPSPSPAPGPGPFVAPPSDDSIMGGGGKTVPAGGS